MSTYPFGSTRSYYAGGTPRIHIGSGKYAALSPADEQLLDAILHCKSYSEEISLSDLKMIEAKAAGELPETQWEPESLGAQIIDKIRQQSKVRNYHQIFNAPKDPFELPVVASDFTASLIGSEGETVTSQPVSDHYGKVVFNHRKLMITAEATTEFEEENIPEMMAFLKNQLAVNLMRAEEKMLFLDDATHGLLANAADKTAAVPEGSLTPANAAQTVMSLLSAMGAPYNLDPANIVMYLHPELYWNLVQAGEVKTQDMYGPSATIISGELGKFYGMSVAPLTTLDAVDGTTPTYPIILANRASVLLSQRRNVTIRVFPQEGDKNKIEATVRTAIAYPHKSGGFADGVVKALLKKA
jgi:HK97 family phage major capsid protein